MAFPLAAIGTVAFLDSVLSRGNVRPAEIVVGASVGGAIGFLAGIDALSFAILTAALLVPLAVKASPARSTETASARGAHVRGFALALPFVALLVASNYSLGLRLVLQGADLSFLAAALMVLAPIAGVLAARRWLASCTRDVQVASFGLAAIALLALGFVSGTVIVTLVLAVAIASLAVAAEATLRRFVSSGRDVSAIVAATVAWLPLFLLFFRMPPVIYSLTIARFPEALEAAFYAPEFLFAAVAAILALECFRRALRSRGVGKGYPTHPTLRTGRSP